MVARRVVLKLAIVLIVSAVVLTALSIPLGSVPPLGGLLEPLGGFWTVADDAVPVMRQTLRFSGLEAPVEVFRDPHGVPHVFAQGDLDLFRAVGYLQASDRLFQLDVHRRAATGNLAEVFDPDLLDQDRFLRSIGLTYGAERTLAMADDESLAVLQAFADGVNVYIREVTPNHLPLEFKLLNYQPKPWTPLDTVAFAKLISWTLSGTFEDLALQLFVDAYGMEAADELFPLVMPLQLPIIPPGPSAAPTASSRGPSDAAPSTAALTRDTLLGLLNAEARVRPGLGIFEGLGSNNWVIAAEKTTEGRPILANDPHLGLTLPSLWYQVRLSSPTYNVYGVSLVGAPLVVIGFNQNVAWGFTNVGADVVDFYVEQVNETKLTYLHEGTWKPLTVREEVIPIQGGQSERFEVWITVHGPILTEAGQTVAMRWTGHEPTNELRGLLNMGRAADAAEFRSALVDWQVPAQNIVYADSAGNIGIAVNGLYPQRALGHLGRLPADGASGAFDWAGFVPMEGVPGAVNPTQGYLVSANQMPTTGNDPYLGWSWADRYRAARINEVLAATPTLSVEDVKALQLDHFSVAAREFLPFLLAAHDAPQASAPAFHGPIDVIPLLRAWNHEMDVALEAPSLYWMWLYEYREGTFRDEWDARRLDGVSLPSVSVLERLTKSEPTSPWFDDVSTAQVETRDDIIRAAFARAFSFLEGETGLGHRHEWGRFHTIQLRHPTNLPALNSPREPRHGGSFTVDVAHGQFSASRLLVTSGPSWRMIVDVGGPMTGYGVYPGGQSGNAVSPHYLDLFTMWMAGEYQSLALTSEAQMAARQG